MNLLTKIIILFAFIVLGSVLLTGMWAANHANSAVLEANTKYMRVVLRAFVDDAVATRHDLLVASGLEKVESFVDAYKEEAVRAAARISEPEDGLFFIVDGAKNIIYQIGTETTTSSKAEPPYRKVATSSGKHAGPHLETERGVEVFASAQFEPWDWTIMFTQREALVHGVLDSITQATLLIAAVSSVSAILFMTFLMGRFFVRPVQRLEALASNVARNQPVRGIEFSSSDELGRLGRSMVAMAVSIEGHRAAQLEWQSMLEERVRHRTEELAMANAELRAEIVERERATKEIQSLALFVDENPNPVFRTSKDGELLYANRASDVLFGAWRDDPIVDALIASAQASLAKNTGIQTEIARDSRVFSVSFTPIVPMNYVNAYARDVTDARQAEAALRENEEMLRHSQKMESVGRLAGGVAHDFNNLLTTIIGYTDLVAPLVTDITEEYVLEIRTSADRAAELTQQLLAYSRQQVLQLKAIDLNGLLADLSNMLGRLIGEDIHLATKLGADLGTIKADSGQIEQVIVNLAVNARDAMPLGGTLTIESQRVHLDHGFLAGNPEIAVGDYGLVMVNDTGHGMDQRTMDQAFEPFFTTKGVGKGTGLGLATAYGIVRQSGGLMLVDSELGRGTTFKIYLPSADDLETPRRSTNPEDASRGAGETVLLVEDGEQLRKMMGKMLKTYGYDVIEASSGAQALEYISGTAPPEIDLLLSDVIMPRMNGPELAEAIVRRLPSLRVLLISGYTHDIALHKGLSDEEFAFLQKPFTPQVLAETVRRVLDGA
jgi:two-component system, cell cycle sensor histidine kinase and response regulator CckA